MEKRSIGSPFSSDGLLHAVESGKPQKPLTDEQLAELQKRNFEKEVCLNCRYPRCYGLRKCFNAQKKKAKQKLNAEGDKHES